MGGGGLLLFKGGNEPENTRRNMRPIGQKKSLLLGDCASQGGLELRGGG